MHHSWSKSVISNLCLFSVFVKLVISFYLSTYSPGGFSNTYCVSYTVLVPGRGLEAGVSKIDGLVCRVTESRSGGNKRDLRNWLPHFSLSHFREAICETGTSPKPVP